MGGQPVGGTYTTSPKGQVTAQFTVPTLPPGHHEVHLTDAEGNTAATTVESLAPQLTLSTTSGTVASTFSVSGEGWPASTTINVFLGKVGGYERACSPVSDAQGRLPSTSCTVPGLPGGEHPVLAIGGGASLDPPAVFTITPRVTTSTTAVVPGSTFSISANGLSPSTPATFSVNGVEVASGVTDGYGRLGKAPTMPDLPAGPTTVRVTTDVGSTEAPGPVVYRPTVTVDRTTVVAGQTPLTLTGAGWPAGRRVSFQLGGAVFCSVDASADGEFTHTCPPPSVPGGPDKVLTAGVSSVGSVTAAEMVTVLPGATLSLASAKPGATVWATGRGLRTARAVELVVGGVTVASGTPSADGTWQRSFVVPANAPAGPLDVRFVQADAPVAVTSLDVQALAAAGTVVASTVPLPPSGASDSGEGAVEGDDAAGEVAPLDVAPAGVGDEGGEPGLVGPGPDGLREVHVRVRRGRDRPRDRR
jgi:hypothetical protein